MNYDEEIRVIKRRLDTLYRESISINGELAAVTSTFAMIIELLLDPEFRAVFDSTDVGEVLRNSATDLVASPHDSRETQLKLIGVNRFIAGLTRLLSASE